MMSEVDTQLGRIFDQLDANGLAERTIVVITSDHGELLGDHWLVQKMGYFDTAFHVPLIIRDPRAAVRRDARHDGRTASPSTST